MAVVKTAKQKMTVEKHIATSIDYVTDEKKAYKVSYNLCSNNTTPGLAREFRITRRAFNKDDKILAHHLIQSFAPYDDISPELAHQIGLELIKKEFPEYQVILSTHIDRGHIHNHFIINSVSPFDGKKFLDNKAKINSIRRTSDRLCYENNLSVLDTKRVTKYKSLDRETMNAAKRGNSWKFNLVKDLDKAFEVCFDKEEFIRFFNQNDYTIKFTDKNIVFQKNGEKKGIRADTLAKQFGLKYSKASIEKKLNIENKSTSVDRGTFIPRTQPINNDYYNRIAEQEWKRYEKRYKDKIQINDSRYFNRILFSKNPLQFTLRLVLYIFAKSNKTAKSKLPCKGNSYKIKSFTDYKNFKKIIGNISYKTILNTPGDTVQIKLYSWQIAKLLNNNVLLSSKIDLQSGTAVVTVKQFDLQRISQILNIDRNSLFAQAKQIGNRKNIYELKKDNKELNYLVITKEQLELLNYAGIKFASYPKGEKFNIAFAPTDKEKILSILYPNCDEKLDEESFYRRNAVINRKLKEKSAKTGEKLCYKIVLSNQYKALRETTIEFAVFRQDDGKYNVVFLESNKAKIEKALGGVSNVKKAKNTSEQLNPNIKI